MLQIYPKKTQITKSELDTFLLNLSISGSILELLCTLSEIDDKTTISIEEDDRATRKTSKNF